MSAPVPFDGSRWRPRPVPAGPLPKAVELERVKQPKKPRAEMNRVGPKRAEKKDRQFAEQAQRCRDSACACCGLVGYTEPHHWPTTAAGGLDGDTMPLCGGLGSNMCHEAFHAAGSPEKFLETHGCDVFAEIEKMRRGARKPYVRDCGPCIPRLIEDRRKLSYRHECVKCQRPMDDPADLDGVQP